MQPEQETQMPSDEHPLASSCLTSSLQLQPGFLGTWLAVAFPMGQSLTLTFLTPS